MNEAKPALPQQRDPLDAAPFVPSYGHGGVPWYLVALYLAFLVFFTWYVLEYQLPDYLQKGPGRIQESAAPPTK